MCVHRRHFRMHFVLDTLLFYAYGVATISRLLKIIGLFCKIALLKRQYFAKETHNFKEELILTL